MEQWIYTDTGTHPGEENMNIDWLLAKHPCNKPVLRFYTWNPAAISLGYHQKIEETEIKRIKEKIDLVRRPTGGRAVLHDKELTYSVTIPAGHEVFTLTNNRIYEKISVALAEGFRNCGIPVEFEKGNPNIRKGFKLQSCFASTARNELKLNGKKLVGSALRRFKTAVIQHGSILLDKGYERIYSYFDTLITNEENATDLKEAGYSVITLNQIKAELLKGFEGEFNVLFEISNIENLIPGNREAEKPYKI